MKPMLSQRARSLITGVCRLVLAVVFIVSGFTKVIDPWGTSIKINEYLTIYGFDYLIPASMVFSIWLCGAEMMMGCMLLCKVRIRLVSIFALVSMLFFTILTFLSATFIPVEDCGCFGEAIKLSPWETFFKNLALLPMAAVVWAYYRNDKILAFRRSEVALTVFFFLLTMGLGFYCYCHLPLIDFLPYKIGVNIREEMHASSAAGPEGELQTVLVYRNRMTGEEREFALDDTEWQDDTVWEWVDTKILGEVPEMNPMIEEFALRNGAEDVTDRVLATPGRLYLICVTRFDCIGRRCEDRLERLVERAVAGRGACRLHHARTLAGKRHPFVREKHAGSLLQHRWIDAQDHVAGSYGYCRARRRGNRRQAELSGHRLNRASVFPVLCAEAGVAPGCGGEG